MKMNLALLAAAAAAMPTIVASALSEMEKMSLVSRVLRVGSSNRPRTLQEDDDAAVLSITTNHSIQFNTCISLTTELSDDMKELLSTYDVIKDDYDLGEIVPLKSYVLFDVCETEKCYYQGESNLYMTDLSTYMGLTAYKPQQTISYCDACANAMEYCLSNQTANGDGERRLNAVQYVDCGKCDSMGCFDAATSSGDDDSKITIESMLQWAQDWSQCQETGVEWNNVPLYATFLCNAEGTGVELGVFLDDDCSTYSKVQPFNELFPNNAYHANSGNVVTYPFTHSIDCNEEIQWDSPENANAADDQAAEESQANQYCIALAQSDFLVPLNNCNSGQDAAQDDNANQQAADNADDTFADWVYDISADDTDNAAAVCSAIKTLEQQEGSYQKAATAKNHYRQAHGSYYKYNASKSQTRNTGSGGMIAGMVIGAVCACALAFYTWKRSQRPVKKPLLERDIQQEL